MAITAVVLLGPGALVGIAFLPQTANHFGYALPRKKGLPYRLHYNGRDYRNLTTCAGADWCETAGTSADRAKPYCLPRAQLRDLSGPLVQVDEVFTLFGSSRAVFAAGNNVPDSNTTEIFVAYSEDCYVSYGRMGGP